MTMSLAPPWCGCRPADLGDSVPQTPWDFPRCRVPDGPGVAPAGFVPTLNGACPEGRALLGSNLSAEAGGCTDGPGSWLGSSPISKGGRDPHGSATAVIGNTDGRSLQRRLKWRSSTVVIMTDPPRVGDEVAIIAQRAAAEKVARRYT